MPWLLEATAWDPATSAEVPIYASHDLRVPILNGVDYEGRLAGPPAWGESVSDSALVQGGRATTSYGALVLILSGGAEHWWRYNWVGRTVTIRRGAQGAAYGAYTTDLVAEVAAAARSRSGSQHRLVLALQGLASKIAQPSPATRYAGTGGIEGGADLRDQPVLQIYGSVRNVTPDLVNKSQRIYRLHDRAINAVTAVYDKGRALTPVANYANYAALAGATVPQGSYATCLAYGLVRLGAEPEGRVTVDAQGDAVGGYVSTAATIFARLAARAGISGGAIDSAAISAVDAAAPFGYALAIRSADITYADLFDRCAQALGAVWRVSRLNVLSLTRLVSAASGGSLALSPIDPTLDELTPPRLVRVSHGHNWTVQTEDELGVVAASAVDGLGWLATSSATATLLLNAAYTAVAATAVTSNSGEAVLCATDADGDQVPGTDFAYSWAGRARRVARHPGHDDASPTIYTQLASKKGFIVHHLGGNGGAFLAPAGALVRNRLLHSESLSVSPWSASGVSVSINAGFDHYGVQGLDRIIEDSSTGWHFIDQTYTPGSDPTGLSWTLSAVVQAGSRSKIQLCFPAAGGVFAMETVCNFDLSTGTRISNTANVTGYGIVPRGGGLYRIWMTAPATGNAPIIGRIFLLDAAGNRSYTGDGSALLYAGHVQLEQASTFTAYQCTTTGPAQRTAFCYRVGTQWYYDRGDGTQVAFTPDSNYIALGWLATSSADTIAGGGLISPVTLTEAAFPAADVTADNTAANTAAVGSTPATDVEGSIANLSPTTGRALASFLAENGIGFAQIFDVGESRDGDTYNWPTTPDSVPRVVPMPAGNAATAGRNITIQAEDVTVSGFTFRAKSQGVTPSSTITDTTEGTGGGSSPDRVINRSNSGQPYDNRWKFQFSVSVPAFGPGEPGSAQVLFFLKKSGVWVQSGSRYYSASGTYTYDVISSSVDFGAGEEFGISIGVDYSPGASITDFLNVKYTLGTVTETSLTPAGASSIPWIALI